MKRWNWRSYAAGMVTATMVFGITGGALAASSGNVSFNTVNISANGVSIAKEGSGYGLQNGAYVPYSITYTDAFGGGTTYVPISKLSEFTGTGVSWDASTNTVQIDADTTAAYDRLTGNSTSYDSGYDAGYQAGLSARSNSGNYDAGYDDGYDDGYDEARDRYDGSGSYSDGYDDGYYDGYYDGRGTNNTSNGSYNDGYNDGYEAGEDDGYDKGYDAGLKDGQSGSGTTDRYQEGYDAGFAAGKAEGKQEGYKEGYEAGYADGEAGDPENPDIPDLPSEPGGSDVEFDRNSVSEEDMQAYLESHVPSTVETPVGTYHFDIDVSKNSSKSIPYDFWITTSHPHDPTWLDFENSLDLDPQDVAETVDILRNYQISIYEAAWECAPGAKMQGGFFNSWYEYPSIQEGYENMKVFSWKNYEDGNVFENMYETSHYSGFEWDTELDDYIFD